MIPAASATADPGATADPRPQRRILIVDDAPIFREIETVFLRRLGEVSTANDGTVAFEMARRERPDLIVTDLVMRDMDGDELCRQLRADPILENTPVVMVTSGRSADEHERAVRAGADDVIEKPIKRLLLLQAVGRFLRTGLRSQARVGLVTDVVLHRDGDRFEGRTLNVSRGGIFVEAERVWEPDSEFSLEFHTPDGAKHFLPTARVAWRRSQTDEFAPGMGLQFLKLERETTEWLEDYIYEVGLARDEAEPAP